MGTKLKSPFVLIISLLCRFLYFHVRSKVSLVYTQYDKNHSQGRPDYWDIYILLQSHFFGNKTPSFPNVGAQSHSLVGFSGIKLNPKSTWKSFHIHCNYQECFYFDFFMHKNWASFLYFTSPIRIFFPHQMKQNVYSHSITYHIFESMINENIWSFHVTLSSFLVEWVKIILLISSPESYIFIVLKNCFVL